MTEILQSEHYHSFRRAVCAAFQGGMTMEQLATHYQCHRSVIEFAIRDGLTQERKT
ncbi:MAG: hypothetical protein NTAFB01_13070 [Nitrospira sp.]